MSVMLVDHPVFPTDLLRADQSVLDRLAGDPQVRSEQGAADIERFLFGDVPLHVFADLFTPAPTIDGPVGRWLLYLSGYFGGRWLRGEIAAAQPDAPLVGFSVSPTREAFDTTMAHAAVAATAASAAEADVLRFAHTSLLNTEPASGGPATPGLVDSFGYNAGYNMEILDSPPAGVEVPATLDVRCTGLLRCHYASPRLAVLADLEDTATRLNGGDDRYRDLSATLQPIQDEALPRGRSVWSTGLSVQGFDQVHYVRLLEVSSSFLETVQATALTMVRAVIEQDAGLAARGARAEAGMRVWLSAYMSGLLHGEGTIELPRFI